MVNQEVSSLKFFIPLQNELEHGAISSVFVCFMTNRWYVGELFCHASWVECFKRAGIKITFCTNQDYLNIFQGHPNIKKLLPLESFPENLSEYDLAVFTSTHPPYSYHEKAKRAIYSYNKALEYVESGRLVKYVNKSNLNHFLAATHQRGQTALPDGTYYQMWLSELEKQTALNRINSLFTSTPKQLIVINPTASNPYTRQSNRPKAVDNNLSIGDYTSLIESLFKEFPEHQFLLGSSLKPGDRDNYQLLAQLSEKFWSEPRIQNLFTSINVNQGLSFREFAAILVAPCVKQIIGNSTGSNSHLAATVNVPSMSIERAADEAMRQNWRSPQRGQMGSFRWRNPQPQAAAFNLSWENRNPKDFIQIAKAFRFHSYAMRGEWDKLFGTNVIPARKIAKECTDMLKSALTLTQLSSVLERLKIFSTLFCEESAIQYYFNFSDEADYLQTIANSTHALVFFYLTNLSQKEVALPNLSSIEVRTVCQLMYESNLYKLLEKLIKAVDFC